MTVFPFSQRFANQFSARFCPEASLIDVERVLRAVHLDHHRANLPPEVFPTHLGSTQDLKTLTRRPICPDRTAKPVTDIGLSHPAPPPPGRQTKKAPITHGRGASSTSNNRSIRDQAWRGNPYISRREVDPQVRSRPFSQADPRTLHARLPPWRHPKSRIL